MRPESAEGLADNIEYEAHDAKTLYEYESHQVPAADFRPQTFGDDPGLRSDFRGPTSDLVPIFVPYRVRVGYSLAG